MRMIAVSLAKVVVCCLALVATSALGKDSQRGTVPEVHREVLVTYCYHCHDSDAGEGGVDLERLSFSIQDVETAEAWQKVLNVMNSGEMPPKDARQLSFDEKSKLLADVANQVVIAREQLSDTGGVITMRRLNRREYENSVEDLLGVRIEAKTLPDDANTSGFDTVGSALFFSSDQFEQYLTLARESLDAAMVFGKKPPVQHIERESETNLNRFYAKFSGRLKENYERAQQWRANSEAKTPADYDFIDESDVRFHERLYNQQYATYRQYLDRPEAKSGALLYKFFNGAVLDRIEVPKKWPAGQYRVTVKAAVLPGSESHEQFLEYGYPGDGARSGELNLLGCVRVTGTLEEPQTLSVPIRMSEGGPREIGFRQRQHNNRDAVRAAFLEAQRKDGVGPAPALWIDRIEIDGPFYESWPPPSVSKIFFKGMWWQQDDVDAYAKAIIKRFARRAFRIKEPTEPYLERLYQLYRSETTAGKTFPQAIREPLAVILASPGFLYLVEPADGKAKRELTDLELAVRLSYFLWSGPPDESLFADARAGKLKAPETLLRHANRMLDDPRSNDLIASFAHQWLQMERLDFFQYDHRLYPEFDDSVKEAARQEVYQTIRFLLKENRPLSELLKSDYVVVNDLLADYYGIAGVEGSEFRPVRLASDSPRGGLLGMAAIHAMGSDGTQSSIVERGAWVMRRILHDPPPPAPPNVPQLSRVQGRLLSPREELAAHMEQAQCASCHSRIDPIGYGLQNFDAAGKWRDELILQKVVGKKVREKKVLPIDPSGRLPDGSEFADYFQLRELIAEKKQAFSHSFANALIEYALGRPYGFADQNLRTRILKQAEDQNGSMREVVLALVTSEPFRIKK